MKATDIIAIAKAISDKEVKAVRDQINPGIYPVNLTVNIIGSIRIAEDTFTTVTPKPDYRTAFGLLLEAYKRDNHEVDANKLAKVLLKSSVTNKLPQPIEENLVAIEATLPQSSLDYKPRRGAVKADLEVQAMSTKLAAVG